MEEQKALDISGQEECLVLSVNVGVLHSCAVAIGSIMHWISHLQCCVLITHSTVVKVRIGLNVHAEMQTNITLSKKCLSCVYTPHRVG